MDIESLESVLKHLHSPEIGDSALAQTRRVTEIISSLQMSDSRTARALALAMLIESTIEQALIERDAPDKLEMAIVDLLYAKRLSVAEAASMLGISARSLVRKRPDAIFALAKRLIRQLADT